MLGGTHSDPEEPLMSTATTPVPTTADDSSLLWKGAAATAFAAVLFPRLNAVLHEDQKIWQLDNEAAVLIPVIVAVTAILFAVVGWPSWRAPRNRPAVVSVVCGVLAILGIVAFWVCAPIILGGLASTLGAEGLRRAPLQQRRGLALTGVGLGTLGVLVGAGVWLVNL